MFESYYARKTGKRWIINPDRLRYFLGQWMAAKQHVFRILVDLAMKQEIIDYTTIGRQITVWDSKGLCCRDKKLHELLGEISVEAHEKGFPLLSALVYNKSHEEPGGGYWDLLSKFYSGTDYEKLHEEQLSLIYSSDWSNLELKNQYLIKEASYSRRSLQRSATL